MADQINHYTFHIEELHRAYLQVQKGKLHNFIAQGPHVWDRAYNDSINKAYNTLLPHLPDTCDSVLDVGSGLGGICAMINWHYKGILVGLLDGVADKPEVVKHNKTFNDMAVAHDFLSKNGVDQFMHYDPENLRYPIQFDLILSSGAWNFHFPPGLYLDFIKQCTHPGTVIITDVRKGKPEWLCDLEAAFGPHELIREAEKFVKVKFICR